MGQVASVMSRTDGSHHPWSDSKTSKWLMGRMEYVMQKTFYLVLEELENRTGNLEYRGLKGWTLVSHRPGCLTKTSKFDLK